jgi:hypothetical protein
MGRGALLRDAEEEVMRTLLKAFCIVGALAVAVATATPQSKSLPAEDDRSMMIIFKDGHQQTFRLADIARIEFSTPTTTATAASHGRFLGVWKVGVGGGSSGTFLITLKRDGVAEKTMGAPNGTWTVVNGEARCKWDDGWTDVIRKVGGQWEKAAWAPGSSLDAQPTSVAKAEYTESN